MKIDLLTIARKIFRKKNSGCISKPITEAEKNALGAEIAKLLEDEEHVTRLDIGLWKKDE